MASRLSQHSFRQARRATRVDDINSIRPLDRNSVGLDYPPLRTLHQLLPIPLALLRDNGMPPLLLALPNNRLVGLVVALLDRPLDQRAIVQGALGALDGTAGRHDDLGFRRLDP